MDNSKEDINEISFYCPICGKWVKQGDSYHHCPESFLESLNNEDEDDLNLDKEIDSHSIGEMLAFAEMLANLQEDEWDLEENEEN
jgi:hypothetical protein